MATTLPAFDRVPRAKSGIGLWLGRFDDWLERAGERLNPILIKECRQSLKGRQFSLTFALVLVCCWVWSIWGVMMMGPNVHFGAASPGMNMFSGYFVIMAFPLLVIVPHGAFRSLVDEREDRTFELLAISNLSPRQIYMALALSAIVFPTPPALVEAWVLLGLALPFLAGVWGAVCLYEGFICFADTIPAACRQSRKCFLRRLILAWCGVYTFVTPLMIYTLWNHFSG